jgi:GNAT superfamily N-acetyltransferase
MLTIREAQAADSAAIAAIHAGAIRGLCSSHYEPHQIEAWASRRTKALYDRVLQTQAIQVAERDGQMVGFGQLDLESGQIIAVYVAPESARTGVGEAILRHLEAIARLHGWSRLHLTASLNAVPFYEKMGYERVGPFEHEVATDVMLPCVNMRKAFPREAESAKV